MSSISLNDTRYQRSLRACARHAFVVAFAAGFGCGGGAFAEAPKHSASHGQRGYDEPATAEVQAESTSDRDEGYGYAFNDAPRAPADMAVTGNALGAPPPPPPPPSTPANPTTPTSTDDKGRDGAQIVYTANLSIAVYQVDQGLARVEAIAREVGGYLTLKRTRDITIRVPRAKFEQALAAVDGVGDVLSRNVQAEDVTDEYVDLEIRIKNARAMQARLQQLLQRAEVKDALEIEKELHRVTEELERLEGKLKLLRDRVAYSTITVSFQARGAGVQATRVRLPFPWLSELGLPNLLSLEESK